MDQLSNHDSKGHLQAPSWQNSKKHFLDQTSSTIYSQMKNKDLTDLQRKMELASNRFHNTQGVLKLLHRSLVLIEIRTTYKEL